MSLLLTFMELDRLYEQSEDQECQRVITQIRNTKTGKNYQLTGRHRNKDELLSILAACLEKDKQLNKPAEEPEDTTPKCTRCKTGLSPEGRCPKCDPDFGMGDLD